MGLDVLCNASHTSTNRSICLIYELKNSDTNYIPKNLSFLRLIIFTQCVKIVKNFLIKINEKK